MTSSVLNGTKNNDTFNWNPGDGSQSFDGLAGVDTLRFAASGAAENLVLTANAGHLMLARDVASVMLDLNNIEHIAIATAGGADTLSIGDMDGTAVKQIDVDLGLAAAGDGAVDSVNLYGGSGKEVLTLATSAGALLVNGLAAAIRMEHAESNDRLQLASGDGDDAISAGALPAGLVRLTLDGGAGNDTLTGGSGSDTLLGGYGNDVLRVGGGQHTVDGGAGSDTLELNNGASADTIQLKAIGDQIRIINAGGGQTGVTYAVNVETTAVYSGGGDDAIIVSDGTAPLTKLVIDAGDGNDIIVAGDSDDLLLGGSGNDVVNGGAGNDTALLGSGNDTYQWAPGAGNDTIEGMEGSDTLQFQGSAIGETISLQANGSRALLTRDLANVKLDLNGLEQISIATLGGADAVVINDLAGTAVKLVEVDLGVAGGGDGALDKVQINGTAGKDSVQLNANGGVLTVSGLAAAITVNHADGNDSLSIATGAGNDAITVGLGVAALAKLVLDGGAGNDTIGGGSGADILIGGDGNDSINGGAGADVALLGNGDDVFSWVAGDGNDTVEGMDGADALQMTTTDVVEAINIKAFGSRALLTRDIANASLDLNGVERIALATRGGADSISIDDLAATAVKLVELELGLGNAGDNAADSVQVNGTAGKDVVQVGSSAGKVTVTGLGANVQLAHMEAADQLSIATGMGDDVINAEAKAAATGALSIDSGAGNDTLVGSAGNDTLHGGAGNDIAMLGKGDDRYTWNAGDGSDVLEGQDGYDTLQMSTASMSEKISIGAQGARVLLARDVANVTLDMNGVEHIVLSTLGGDDTITLNDVSGTALKLIELELGSSPTGDGGRDTIMLNATAGKDNVVVNTTAEAAMVSGLAATVQLQHLQAGDTLVVLTGAGDDKVSASGVQALTIDGGSGNDSITGGAGSDLLLGGDGNDSVDGGAGNDKVLLGSGNDVFSWTPGGGNDTVEGMDGDDTLDMNSSNASEKISIDAFGGRVLLVRDVANIKLDMNSIEHVVLNTLGGADTVAVGNLDGTALKLIDIDLGSAAGGDGAVDSVLVQGTSGKDSISVSQFNGVLSVTGLSASVQIVHAESGDQLVVATGAGDDTLTAAGVRSSGAAGVTLDGGAGNDTLIGGAGNDILIGGAGVDSARGGAGKDSFVAAAGKLRVEDFTQGSDKIDFHGLGLKLGLEDVLAGTVQQGADAVIHIGAATTVTLVGVNMDKLHASDFIFG